MGQLGGDRSEQDPHRRTVSAGAGDEQVDPFDLKQVIWAMTTRFRPERDLVLIPNAPASTLDPAHLGVNE